MKAIQIHGKDYYPVVERVKEFRKLYPKGTIDTIVVNFGDDSILIKAEIYDGMPDRIHLATGHAFEEKSWGKINLHSMVENCETSAVGRALAFLGIGISDDIASADEMDKTDEPKASFAQISMIESLLKTANIPENERTKIELEYITFTPEIAKRCITYLKENDTNENLNDQLTRKLK